MTVRRAVARTLTVAAMWTAVVAALVAIDTLARHPHLIPAAPVWQTVLAVAAITAGGFVIHTTKETP